MFLSCVVLIQNVYILPCMTPMFQWVNLHAVLLCISTGSLSQLSFCRCSCQFVTHSQCYLSTKRYFNYLHVACRSHGPLWQFCYRKTRADRLIVDLTPFILSYIPWFAFEASSSVKNDVSMKPIIKVVQHYLASCSGFLITVRNVSEKVKVGSKADTATIRVLSQWE